MTSSKEMTAFFLRYTEHFSGVAYQYDASPIHIFELYRQCRQARAPMPEVVLDYLDKVAACLLSHEPTSDREVAEAFGMVGRMRRNAKNHKEMLVIAQHVWAWQEMCPRMPITAVYEKVAESLATNSNKRLRRHITAKQVEKACRKFSIKP